MKMQPVKVHPVKSDWIAAIGYDAPNKVLHVHLKSGDRYTYHDVSPEKHAALMAAESHGKHLNLHIKGSHESKKLVAPVRRKAA